MIKKSKLIRNDDHIVAHHVTKRSTELQNYKFGQLKQLFIAGKIKYPISKIYVPRLNKNFHVTYAPTRGFTIKLWSPTDIPTQSATRPLARH